MRDERWVNRFLYAWNDTLFFDPLDVYCKPRQDHSLAPLDEQTRNRFVRKGIWWGSRHNPNLPAQGSKIHVSANQRNVFDIADKVTRYLIQHNIDFKTGRLAEEEQDSSQSGDTTNVPGCPVS